MCGPPPGTALGNRRIAATHGIPHRRMTPEQMQAATDLVLVVGGLIVVLLLVLAIRGPLARFIDRADKVKVEAKAGREGVSLKVEAERIQESWKQLPPPDPDPRAVIANADPKVTAFLVDANGKPMTFEEMLVRFTQQRGLPQTPTSWTNGASLLTTATTTRTVAASGSTAMQGDQVTFTIKPDVRPLLEEKAKEAKPHDEQGKGPAPQSPPQT